jgi:hypothetical protein
VRSYSPGLGGLSSIWSSDGKLLLLTDKGELFVSEDEKEWTLFSEALTPFHIDSIETFDGQTLIFQGNKRGETFRQITDSSGNTIWTYMAYTLYAYDLNDNNLRELFTLSEETGRLEEVNLYLGHIIVLTSKMYYNFMGEETINISLPRGVDYIWSSAVDPDKQLLYIATNDGIIYRSFEP